MYNILDQRLQFLPGVGPEKANILQAELDIRTVRDLLLYFPYRYVDRSVIYRICELTNDMPYVQLRGKVLSASEEGLGRSRRYEASFSDDSGIVKLVWFAGINYIKKTVVPGREFVVLGKPVLFNMTYSLSHPEIEEIKTDAPTETLLGIHPVYHTTEKMKRRFVTSKFLEKLVVLVFQQLGNERISDTLSKEIRLFYNLMPLHEAIRSVHLPQNMQEVSKAQYRYKF